MMVRLLLRAVLFAMLGALAGTAALAAAYRANPALTLEMDRDAPGVVSGMYPVERNGRETFAWSRGSVTIALPGLDRETAWSCVVRFRGARPPELPQPTVAISADGVLVGSRTATNEYDDFAVDIPPRQADGLTLTVAVAPTFVPSASDRRELGAQIDRIACQPSGARAWPPRDALVAAAIGAAFFGSLFGSLPWPAWSALVGTALLAAGQAVPLATGAGPYTSYVDAVPGLAGWIAVVCAAVAAGAAWRFHTLSVPALVALAVSGGALYIELLALLHPGKLVIDALFHAHRLEWVMSGRYYFTQPMPSGVRFPYAIALYVISMPWTALTHDYIALLTIVVSVARALAGLALFPLVARAWNDRAAGVLAVLLFHSAPLPFVAIGNANLTYAFGQSAMALTLAAAATWPLAPGRAWQVAGLFALASTAFLSHVGIFPIALAMLAIMAALYWWMGGQPLRASAHRIAAVTVLAAIVSVVSYYGHFTDSYRTLARARARADAVADGRAISQGAGDRRLPSTTVSTRVVRAGVLAKESFGPPALILAAVGAWRTWRRGVRDRLGLLVVASALASAVFVGFSVLAPVDPAFQRYNEEFISRIDYATVPVIAVLAGAGATGLWRAGLVGRVAAATLVLAAAAGGVNAWERWLA
jgi:hypothetical protein